MQTRTNSQDLFTLANDENVQLSTHWCNIFLNTITELQKLKTVEKSHRHLTLQSIQYNLKTGEVTLVMPALVMPALVMPAKAGIHHLLELHNNPYIAPELRRSPRDLNEKTEIYSLGVTFNLLLDFAAQVRGRSVIDNPETRDAVFSFLQRMVDRQPSDRVNLDDSCKFFTRMQTASLRATSQIGIFAPRKPAVSSACESTVRRIMQSG